MGQLLDEAVSRLLRAKLALDNVGEFTKAMTAQYAAEPTPKNLDVVNAAGAAQRAAEARFYSAAVMVCHARGAEVEVEAEKAEAADA